MEIRIRSIGEGPAVAILHGTPTSPAHMEILARGLTGVRSLIVTLPGYDGTTPLEPFTLEGLYSALEAALAPDAPVACVGYSGGGYHALALATRGGLPLRVVVSLAGFADTTDAERAALAPVLPILRSGAIDLAPTMPERMLSARGRLDPTWCEDVIAWARAVPSAVLADELEALLRAPDLRPALRDVDVSVTFRVGTLDVASPVVRSERAAAATRRSTLEIVPDVGHALLHEDREGTIASVQRAIDAVR